jgi:hypothetical protein
VTGHYNYLDVCIFSEILTPHALRLVPATTATLRSLQIHMTLLAQKRESYCSERQVTNLNAWGCDQLTFLAKFFCSHKKLTIPF